MSSPSTASPESFTISREELVDVASDAECNLRIFAALTGRQENDLTLRLAEAADKILALFDHDGDDDAEVRLRGSEKALAWLDELVKDERKLLDERRLEADDV